MAPHVDLSKKDPFTASMSSHTLLLYLKDCQHGGQVIMVFFEQPY